MERCHGLHGEDEACVRAHAALGGDALKMLLCLYARLSPASTATFTKAATPHHSEARSGRHSCHLLLRESETDRGRFERPAQSVSSKHMIPQAVLTVSPVPRTITSYSSSMSSAAPPTRPGSVNEMKGRTRRKGRERCRWIRAGLCFSAQIHGLQTAPTALPKSRGNREKRHAQLDF